MEQGFESLMELYEQPPNLMLFGDLLSIDYTKEIEIILGSFGAKGKELNPADVIIESLINVKSEKISTEQLTHSSNKVLINEDILKTAIKEIRDELWGNPKKLARLHGIWLEKITTFLKDIHQSRKNLRIEEAIFLISRKFRISALSAIRAIVSVAPNFKPVARVQIPPVAPRVDATEPF